MKIRLNGDDFELAAPMTISALLDQLMLTGKRLAVEVNREIIPKSNHHEATVQENDVVEIVHAIGGG